jgi:YVTN family beta-propeller protein
MNLHFQTTLLSLALLGFPAIAQAGSAYAVDSTLHVEGDLGWDLLTVDDSTGNLFLTHGDRIQVVDLGSGKLLGTVSGLKGAHDVTLVGSRGFATSGKDSSVVVFDRNTYEVLQRFPAGGAKPDAMAYDRDANRIFVGLGGSDALSVIDPATSKIVGKIALPGNPELMVVGDKNRLFVAIESKSQIAVVDTRTLKLTATWSVAPGEEPTGIAFDSASGRIFAGCSNHLVVVLDAKNGKVVAKFPVGDHVDGTAFDPVLQRAYVSAADGTLAVVQEDSTDKFRLLPPVATRKGAKTVALDRKSHHLYLPTASYGPVGAPTTDEHKPKAPILPGTFVVLDVHPELAKAK